MRGQKKLILEYLDTHRGQWIGLPTLVAVSGANRVSARIFDLRNLGYRIENKKELGKVDRRTGTRKVISSYKLI